MKKAFIIALALSSALACSKTDVQYEPTGEITITPVNSNVTKSMMGGSAFLGETFNVWAWYSPNTAGQNVISRWQSDFSDDDTRPRLYIDDKPFVKKDDQNNKWGGQVAYFWPKVGSLVFAGYHAPDLTDGTSGNADQVTYTFDGNNNFMTFMDVDQKKILPDGYAEDIMYFNMTPNSYNYANKNVNLSFKHSLSWITVTLAKCVDPRIDATITVSEVKFTEVAHTGTGTVDGSSDITWAIDPQSVDQTYILNTDMQIDYQYLDNGNVATKVYKLDEYLFIPQDINGLLSITYTVESEDKSSFTETYRVRLNHLKDESQRHNKWEPAKHYTYNLTIGTDEIRVDPTVETWGTKDTGISIPLPEDWYDNLENGGQSNSGNN